MEKKAGASANRKSAFLENAAAEQVPQAAKATQPKTSAARPARKKLPIAAPKVEERSPAPQVPAKRKTLKAALNAAANHLSSTPGASKR
jgi:hypothetical protein